MPHGRHHEFARCGHAPFLSHEAQFAPLLRAFVAAAMPP
jgi:pimeloyl-ACP methyl ester carboxylesterase